MIAIWVGIVFLSALWHELGHAVAFRAYHYRPDIQLIMFGGYTNPHASAPLRAAQAFHRRPQVAGLPPSTPPPTTCTGTGCSCLLSLRYDDGI